MKSASIWLELGDPQPKAESGVYTPLTWPAGAVRKLQQSAQIQAPELAHLLSSRRSIRSFSKPASDDDFAALLDLCCRTQATRSSPFGFDLEFRPHPSSGAIQPIHILVQRMAGEEWLRYEAQRHELIAMPGSAAGALAARQAAQELTDTDNASLIAFVSEPGKTAAKYAQPESLVWRDAGVLLGYMSICAHALGLGFCPLGITGAPHLNSVLDQQGRLRGVGLALLGHPVP